MIADLVLRLPLLAAYVLGAVLTCLLVARRRNASSVLGFLGFFILMGVQLVQPFTTSFVVRLHSRGAYLTRTSFLSGLVSLVLNLISAVAVLSIVGAIALAARNEKRS